MNLLANPPLVKARGGEEKGGGERGREEKAIEPLISTSWHDGNPSCGECVDQGLLSVQTIAAVKAGRERRKERKGKAKQRYGDFRLIYYGQQS